MEKIADCLTCGGATGSMKRVLTAGILVSMLLNAGASFGQTQSKELPAVMVLNVKHEEAASPGLANILTGLVLQNLHDMKRFRVVGMKDVDQMLSQEQRKQLAGCTDTSCLVEIAGAMGTQYTLDGTVGVVGSSNVLSLTLIDASKATVVSRKTAVVKGENEQLLGIVQQLISDLMEPITKAPAKGSSQTAAKPEVEQPAVAAQVSAGTPMNPYQLWGVGVWGGLAVISMGSLFTALSSEAADDYKKGASHVGSKDDITRYDSLAVTGYILGGAMLATGMTLWILSPGDEAWAKEHGVSIAPTVEPGLIGAAISGGW